MRHHSEIGKRETFTGPARLYGTLFDVYSVRLLAEQLFPGQGARLATLWRENQIQYTRLVTCCRGTRARAELSGRVG